MSGDWWPVTDREAWTETRTERDPEPLTQSWAWGEARERSGTPVERYAHRSGSAVQVEVRSRGPLRAGWAPGGPFPGGASLEEVQALAHLLRMPLALSPHEPLPGAQRAIAELYLPGSAYLDLTRSEEELLAAMRGRWRNALRKAEKSGLSVDDDSLTSVFGLLETLASKKGFTLPYEEAFLGHLVACSQDDLRIRVARRDGQIMAGWVDVAGSATATYLVGAATDAGREVNAAYLLAWDSVRVWRERGMRFLDLGGLEPGATAGPSMFKAGMGGTTCIYPGTYVVGPRSRLLSAWLTRGRHR